eukprot:867691-Amorphochlora_amoeboformis.AAC.1
MDTCPNCRGIHDRMAKQQLEAIEHVLQFLEESGFSASLTTLEKESGLKCSKSGGKKAGYLLSALGVYQEYLNPKGENKEKKLDREIEDHLVNPKGGKLKLVSQGISTPAEHKKNVIDVRFCTRSGCENIGKL